MKKILTNIAFTPEQTEALNAMEGVELAHFDDDMEHVAAIAEDVVGFHPFGRAQYLKVIELCPNLEWIGVSGTGYESLPTAAIKERGITFTNARGITSPAIAEDVLLKILFQNKNYSRIVKSMEEHNWLRFTEAEPSGELSGLTVSIFGMGTIGTNVASRLQAMGMYTIGFRSNPGENPHFNEIYTDKGKILEIVSRSDFVVCTMPSNTSTHGFFSKEVIGAMKPTAHFINVSRGTLVDEDALVEALQTGKIAGAALDVVKVEPLAPDHPLWDCKNVLLTSHLSFWSDRTEDNLNRFAFEQMLRFGKGEQLHNIVEL